MSTEETLQTKEVEINGDIDQEVKLEITLPNGDSKSLYYKFDELSVEAIEEAKLYLIIWNEMMKNPPRTIADLQKEMHQQAWKKGATILLYTKDNQGNPQPYEGNINKHEPFQLAKYIKGSNHNTLVDIQTFFLAKFGVIPHNLEKEFRTYTDLLLSSNQKEIQSLIQIELEKKGVSEQGISIVSEILNKYSQNSSNQKSTQE